MNVSTVHQRRRRRDRCPGRSMSLNEAAVHVPSVSDTGDLDPTGLVVDSVEQPVVPTAQGPDPGEFRGQWLTGPWILRES